VVAKFRALRFVHPDFDVVEQAAGLQVSPGGSIQMIEEEGSIRQAILCILSTATGERVMRPEYGCDLDRLMFMQSDETLLGLAIHLVRKALERWEPRIEIKKVDAEFNKNEPGRLDILLDYRVRSTASADSLMVPINLS